MKREQLRKGSPMKRPPITFLYVALASIAIALSSSSALAQSRAKPRAARGSETDRRALMALEDEWLAKQRDSTTLERILALDFQHVIESGAFLTKAQHIAWCVAHPLPASHKAHFEKLQVRFVGDIGIASGIVSSSEGKARASRSVFTDVFAFRGGRWQAVLAQETRMVIASPNAGGKRQKP
ncbi:MAG TPA: nuclear transport factor 2 family protein [Gemmatimonadaceae bacterium]|nr:nuclear transport factor 2 family protein [Gemmatimonadaceae bacterium]